MYTTKILSVATAAAIITTGAMAFEAASGNYALDPDVLQYYQAGTIVSENGTNLVVSSYDAAKPATTPIEVDGTQKGDALIYPRFTQQDGFGTEIVVRNTSNRAIVAKAVLYSDKDSKELLDFNIYLSGRDSCRFVIKDGKITSTDGSIKTYGVFPYQAKDDGSYPTANDYTNLEFGDTRPFELEFGEEDGYVVIFGMEQTTENGLMIEDTNLSLDGNSLHFHNKHAELYAAYAASLDKQRGKRDGVWRALHDPATPAGTTRLLNSMFYEDVATLPAPNVAASGYLTFASPTQYTFDPDANSTENYYATEFESVDNVLIGDVRIFAEGRDMLLSATAVQNFTEEGTTLLWTEGEYASIADRRIDLNTTGKAIYDPDGVKEDAEVFKVTTITYTFANKALGEISQDNILNITQPYKRLLAQLGLATSVGYLGGPNYTSSEVDTGEGYYFSTTAKNLFDEDENTVSAELGGTIITSGPGVLDSLAVTYNREVERVGAEAFEGSESYADYFKDKNGFADFNISIPAIVTQMVGSKAGASAEMNWVYNDTTK